MHRAARWIAALAAFGFPPLQGTGALAQDFGDVEAGHAFARQVCATCHAVEAEQTVSPHPGAPTFRAAANVPGMTGTALVVFLRTPHSDMPDLVLPPEKMRDVVAYILTLKDGS